MGELTWTRRYSFQSVHSLDVGVMRERKHGHRYHLEITFGSRDINRIDKIVESAVLQRLHGREVLEIHPSTGENIVEWIDKTLRAEGADILAVALQETRKNRFVSSLSEARYV